MGDRARLDITHANRTVIL